MGSYEPTGAPTVEPYSRNEREMYFNAVATTLAAKLCTARRRANGMAKLRPYTDVAAAGLARGKAAIKAYVDLAVWL